jgi:hypothetical protein
MYFSFGVFMRFPFEDRWLTVCVSGGGAGLSHRNPRIEYRNLCQQYLRADKHRPLQAFVGRILFH